jgi:tetratricopeptide (TPR) repeat protein
MLAPLRDYLRPEDPTSSPLLHATKECYFKRLSVDVSPGKPGHEEAQWITSEDVNVEHLLNVFTSINTHSDNVWKAYANFMRHLYWFKPRLVMVGSKLEGLPDDHRYKPTCLFRLSQLFDLVGNLAECKRLLVYTSGLWRGRRDNIQIAQTLVVLASTNRRLLLLKEGILQARESLGIFEWRNHVFGQAHSLQQLAWLLWRDKQLDAAEEAATRSIDLLPDGNHQLLVCQGRRILGDICHSKGETEAAINHFEAALGVASSFSWHHQQLRILYSLAMLFFDQGRFDDAHIHIKRAKLHVVNDTYYLGRVMKLQAHIWYEQGRFEEAESGVLCAVGVFETLGAAKDVGNCRELLRQIEEKTKTPVVSGEPDSDGELPEMAPLPTPVDLCSQLRDLHQRFRSLSPYPSANHQPQSRLNSSRSPSHSSPFLFSH